MPLDNASLEQIRIVVSDAVAKLLNAPAITDRILTQAEAIAYTKHGSLSAFYRWCSRWRITSAGPGRYSRGHIDSALDREAAKRRQPKPAPPRPSSERAAAGPGAS